MMREEATVATTGETFVDAVERLGVGTTELDAHVERVLAPIRAMIDAVEGLTVATSEATGALKELGQALGEHCAAERECRAAQRQGWRSRREMPGRRRNHRPIERRARSACRR